MAAAKKAKSFSTGGSTRRPRILTNNITAGRPGFSPGVTRPADSGQKVPADTAVSVQSPTRRMKIDPAKSSSNIGTGKDAAILGTVKPAVTATLETNLAGNNNDVHFDAHVSGTGGNAITVAYVDPGGVTAALSVTNVGNAVTVNLARAASAIITTANDIIAAIRASAAVSLVVQASLKTGNDGTGIVTALAATGLTGGAVAVTTPARAVNTVPPQAPGSSRAPNFVKGNAQPTGQIGIQAGRNKNRGVRISKNN